MSETLAQQQRRDHWESVYSSKNFDAVSWYQPQATQSLSLINASQIELSSAIIDVGGGASKLTDDLLSLGYNDLTVLDVSASALSCLKERLGNKAENVNWIVEDITQFQPTKKYKLWHDRAVFHFLTEQTDRTQYINHLKQALDNKGNLIISAFAINGPQKCSGLPIVQYNEDKMQATLGSSFQLIESRQETHITPWQSEQAFNYYWFKYNS